MQGYTSNVIVKSMDFDEHYHCISYLESGRTRTFKTKQSRKWSRRMNDKDQLLYQAESKIILVIPHKGYYTDA